jgi:hypothetical protein
VQDGRIFIELVNLPFLLGGGSPEQYRAGIKLAIEGGWFEMHENGTYLRFTRPVRSWSPSDCHFFDLLTNVAALTSRPSQSGHI